MKLIEVEASEFPIINSKPAVRKLINCWQRNDGKVSIECCYWVEFRGGMLEDFFGYLDAVIIGEIDKSRSMEPDRILYRLGERNSGKYLDCR